MSLLNKEPVKRVEDVLKKFYKNFEVIVLDTSARTAKDAAKSLNCEIGAIIKSLLFKTDNTYTLFLVSGEKKPLLTK